MNKYIKYIEGVEQPLQALFIESIIANPDCRIAIVSGEGECGSDELFTGARSARAIQLRLTKERCHGDRWAYAVIETNSPERCDGHAIAWNGDYADNAMWETTFPE